MISSTKNQLTDELKYKTYITKVVLAIENDSTAAISVVWTITLSATQQL